MYCWSRLKKLGLLPLKRNTVSFSKFKLDFTRIALRVWTLFFNKDKVFLAINRRNWPWGLPELIVLVNGTHLLNLFLLKNYEIKKDPKIVSPIGLRSSWMIC